ncbi:decarboxylase [Nocardioides rotundus]|uniref:pyridoxal phosphate-dependent decarboxylase family protein n=1 Tax=Nocardioides rotundus TaxID=1774216 RepID=UPI001CBC1163|nr:pyridoxal-dependent decarboxylase [Nocardioides rotundus]UAL28669.1 decarboxylase [Nocardioides rotundus]
MSPTPPSARQQIVHPRHADHWRAQIDLGLDRLQRRMAGMTGPSTGCPPTTAEALAGGVDLDRPLGDLGQALTELERVWLDDAVWFADPGYAAHLNPPVVAPALVADCLSTAMNTSMDTFDQSVGATFIERALVAWTASRIGWAQPAAPDGVFTSGGTQSNLQGLLLARDTAREAGVPLDRMRVLCSADAHFSVSTGARLLGLGADAVVAVPVDRRHRMDPDALAVSLDAVTEAGDVPIAVVATAGTTDFGAVDPLSEVARHARHHGAWLHVDAAYGGALLVSPRHRDRLAGIELADSVTVDFHKTWFQPVACSLLLVRDGDSLRHVAWHADYLNPPEGTDPHQVDKSLQTTRRFDALKVWLTLRVMGADQVGGLLDDLIDLAGRAHAALSTEYPDIEIAAPPELTTLVFRCHPLHSELGEPELTELNQEVRQRLYASGAAMVAATRVDGRQFLKLTLLNPLATLEDVLAIVDRACGAMAELTTELPRAHRSVEPAEVG